MKHYIFCAKSVLISYISENGMSHFVDQEGHCGTPYNFNKKGFHIPLVKSAKQCDASLKCQTLPFTSKWTPPNMTDDDKLDFSLRNLYDSICCIPYFHTRSSFDFLKNIH